MGNEMVKEMGKEMGEEMGKEMGEEMREEMRVATDICNQIKIIKSTIIKHNVVHCLASYEQHIALQKSWRIVIFVFLPLVNDTSDSIVVL